MFGQRVINYINKAMPELQDLQILVDGHCLKLGGYEMLNALIVQNNVLDDTKKSIAIFHPKSDLLDVFILIIMGLAAYKDSIIKNSKLRLNDFKQGELVEYEGRIVRYEGVFVNPGSKSEMIRITFGDEYFFWPTTNDIPVESFPEISKYHGSKTVPDKSTSKKNKSNVKSSLLKLLGNKQQNIGLSGYPSFLISSERAQLIDLLKNVSINGTPFFDMFPSVKCTSENRKRLGRDRIQRSFMFYFVSSLSTADDILRAEPKIRTLFVDARGKTLNDGTLLASIRNQYDLEDIYWLQTYDKLDSVDKLDTGLGFKIWIWDKNDFAELVRSELEKPYVGSDDFARMVEEHNITPHRLANYSDLLLEVPYPEGMTTELHDLIQKQIRGMFSLSSEYGSTDLQNFSIHAAGVANRIFQSPIPTGEADKATIDSGRRTFSEDITFLKERITILSASPLPENFKNQADELISNLESSIISFTEYFGKLNQAISIIKENPDKKICVLVNPKYHLMSPVVNKKLISELEKTGNHLLKPNVSVADNLTQAVIGNDIIIWTFKPPYREFIMLEPGVGKNYISLYPLQRKEFETLMQINSRQFHRYLQTDYRAEILKVPVDLLEKEEQVPLQTLIEKEAFDMEKLLTYTMANALPSYADGKHAAMVDARMVLFSDGTHALFQTGNKIKVLDLENATIETKTIGSLSEGDEVAFLKDSKRTVFEELVEFYQHKPEVIELVKLSELWRTALLTYKNEHYLHPVKIKKLLDDAGLVRHISTIENWLDGTTICPDEDNYSPVDTIAHVTGNVKLQQNLEKVKDAARKMHALRIKIGRYLAKRITQSYISPESIIDDPVLRNKLDEISSHVHIARVSLVNDEISKVPADITNKLLLAEDM